MKLSTYVQCNINSPVLTGVVVSLLEGFLNIAVKLRFGGYRINPHVLSGVLAGLLASFLARRILQHSQP